MVAGAILQTFTVNVGLKSDSRENLKWYKAMKHTKIKLVHTKKRPSNNQYWLFLVTEIKQAAQICYS